MIGFKAGVALVLASTQLPKLFGVKGAHGDFWERMGHFVSHVGETNAASLALGLAALAVLLLGKSFLPNKPVALFVVIGGIVAASLVDLGGARREAARRGAAGPAARSACPRAAADDLNELLPLAMACFLLGAVETAAIGRMFARKHGYRLDTQPGVPRARRREPRRRPRPGLPGQRRHVAVARQRERRRAHAALGPGRGAASCWSSRSSSPDLLREPAAAGARRDRARGRDGPVQGRRRSSGCGACTAASSSIAIAALVGVLGSGLLRGVLIGAVISILLLLRRASRPHVADPRPHPGHDALLRPRRATPRTSRVPGVLVVPRRGVAPLLQRRARARDRLGARAAPSRRALRLVVCDLVHLAARGRGRRGDARRSCTTTSRTRASRFRIVEARGAVRDILRAEGLEERVGAISRPLSLDEVLAEPRG